MTCSGKWEKGPDGWQGEDETVYALLEEYRPWIVWGNSDGNLRVEAKNFTPAMAYVPYVERLRDIPLANYMFADHRGGPLIGGYRGGSNELTLQFTDGLLFVGTCTEGI